MKDTRLIDRACIGVAVAIFLLIFLPTSAGVLNTDRYFVSGQVTFRGDNTFPNVKVPPPVITATYNDSLALPYAAVALAMRHEPETLDVVRYAAVRLKTPASYALLVNALAREVSDNRPKKSGDPYPQARAWQHACEDACKADPNNAEFELLLASAYSLQGKKSEALDALRVAGRLPIVNVHRKELTAALLKGTQVAYGGVSPTIQQYVMASEELPCETYHGVLSKWVKTLPMDKVGLTARADLFRAYSKRYRQVDVVVSALVARASIYRQFDRTQVKGSEKRPRPDPKFLASVDDMRRRITAIGEGNDIPWEAIRNNQGLMHPVNYDDPPSPLPFDLAGAGLLTIVLSSGLMAIPLFPRLRERWTQKYWRLPLLAALAFGATLLAPASPFSLVAILAVFVFFAYLSRDVEAPATARVFIGVVCLTLGCAAHLLAVAKPDNGILVADPIIISVIATTLLMLRPIEWRALFLTGGLLYIGFVGFRISTYRHYKANGLDETKYVADYRKAIPL